MTLHGKASLGTSQQISIIFLTKSIQFSDTELRHDSPLSRKHDAIARFADHTRTKIKYPKSNTVTHTPSLLPPPYLEPYVLFFGSFPFLACAGVLLEPVADLAGGEGAADLAFDLLSLDEEPPLDVVPLLLVDSALISFWTRESCCG